MPRRRAARILVAGGMVVLILGGCHGTVTGTGPGGARAKAPTPGPAAPGGALNPNPVPVPGTGDNNLVTLDAKARSVETTATVTDLSSVHLSGSSVLSATADVVDYRGRDLGTGTLRSDGTDLLVSGTSLQLNSRLRVQPGQVTVDNGVGGTVGIVFSGSVTIASGHLTFQPPAPAPPPGSPAIAPGSPATTAAATTVAPPVAVTGPVTIRGNGLQISGASLHLVNPPADLNAASAEADLSWAGPGSVTTAAGPLLAAYLGVRARQLHATFHRGAAEVEVHGTGLAVQVFADGVPQLRVPVRIDIGSTRATTGFLLRKHAFVWTPRNLANTYDMAIVSIHPGNAAAAGVHVGLQTMPPMFGGEPHALVGGDTAGLKGGDAIASLIARHGDDKRTIGYDAAPGVALVLIIQGNFDPITVMVTTY